MNDMKCLARREYDAAQLSVTYPPILRHPHKQLVHALASAGPQPTGRIVVTRWQAAPLPVKRTLAATEVVQVSGAFDYAGHDAGVWHVNFADPRLFAAYGSGLLAQDELQVAEHPALGSVREALIADGVQALTVDADGPTPVLVAGVERRCTLATTPSVAAGRPGGLYGNRFASAPAGVVRAAVHVHEPPTRTNLIAIAAPRGGRGEYVRADLELALLTAFTGFAAAIAESTWLWPGTAVEIRTGFWGCGAFGGNRQVMTLLQILAARLAGVVRLRFYAFDGAGAAEFAAGAASLERVLDMGAPGEPIADVLGRIADLRYAWGTSDGN